MHLNLLAISALFGVIACSGYGGDITYNNHNNFHVLHDRHHRSHHSRSNSRDSDEKWECRRLGVFNSPNPLTNPLLSAPKIAYFNRNGKEYAIAVCENPQIQILVGKSRGASPDFTQTRDYAVLSASSKSGLTFKCNRRHDRYEAVNLVTGSMARIEALACITVAQNDTAAVAIVNGIVGPLQAAGLHL
ncbi:DUF1525 domain-containing protein [Caenorhabditis elegans]|uniref:DUF1525 domain-containing protein n=1 Tax=Caenorhabditis elegans TaxID=6239 RepID=Q18943_CAEEL|nr:DUF1525 domain-containing protein [Caenorhabditis elegans]CAA98435.1 DUF1525 domain-containing protein [Caenorhabditis elegans]|eukprot:NP_505758.1 Uncharacterized protein CELE_D1054.10 [Caenorhabditis elegans]